jgi:hypothetical protein
LTENLKNSKNTVKINFITYREQVAVSIFGITYSFAKLLITLQISVPKTN